MRQKWRVFSFFKGFGKKVPVIALIALTLFQMKVGIVFADNCNIQIRDASDTNYTVLGQTNGDSISIDRTKLTSNFVKISFFVSNARIAYLNSISDPGYPINWQMHNTAPAGIGDTFGTNITLHPGPNDTTQIEADYPLSPGVAINGPVILQSIIERNQFKNSPTDECQQITITATAAQSCTIDVTGANSSTITGSVDASGLYKDTQYEIDIAPAPKDPQSSFSSTTFSGGNSSQVFSISHNVFPDNTMYTATVRAKINGSLGITGSDICQSQPFQLGSGSTLIVPPPRPITQIPSFIDSLCNQVSDPFKKASCRCCAGDSGSCQNGQTSPVSVDSSQNEKVAGLWTAVGCIPTNYTSITISLVKIGLSLAGGVALLMILAAAFMLSTSQGEPKRTGEARDLLTAAVIGLIFIIFSVAILQYIGVTILQIPGFGVNSTH